MHKKIEAILAILSVSPRRNAQNGQNFSRFLCKSPTKSAIWAGVLGGQKWLLGGVSGVGGWLDGWDGWDGCFLGEGRARFSNFYIYKLPIVRFSGCYL